MGGIINYYHGEAGIVSDCWWQPLGNLLSLQIELEGNPHRVWARDYNTDIGIDPAIRRGDSVVYLRLDDTSGIWVRASDQHGLGLSEAVNRVKVNRSTWMDRWAEHVQDIEETAQIAQDLFDATGEPLRIVVGEPVNDGPATPVSFFLSYSSRNALLARQIYEDLGDDAGVTVWFDMAQPDGNVPDQDDAICRWLEDSVADCHGFLLLLTKSSVASRWVSREIEYAAERQDQQSDFHILILKADEVAVPEMFLKVGKVIDLDKIWWSRGISEELFASIYGRSGRRAWLRLQHGAPAAEGKTLGYRDFAADSGTVVNLDWTTSQFSGSDFRSKELSWQLDYLTRDGTANRIVGGGEKQPVDLDMHPGDRIAFINLRRRWGCTIEEPLPLWMRGDDLAISPDLVLDRYYEAMEVNHAFAPSESRLQLQGRNVWGRTLAVKTYRSTDGRWRDYCDILWAMLRKDVDAADLLRRLSEGARLEIVDA